MIPAAPNDTMQRVYLNVPSNLYTCVAAVLASVEKLTYLYSNICSGPARGAELQLQRKSMNGGLNSIFITGIRHVTMKINPPRLCSLHRRLSTTQ